jgi:pimeloyl-ACP methyl ester carboxylesterase
VNAFAAGVSGEYHERDPGRRDGAPEGERMAEQFVLVHGMSHGAWCWAAVSERLARAGHRVLAVDLPGHGPRAHERHRASVLGYARAVADQVALAGFHRATVVGHSMAGLVIPGVAALVPARVARLVFLAAVVPPDGASLLEAHLSPSARRMVRGLAAAGRGVVQYPAAIEHARWMGDLRPGDPRVVDALSRLTPQPLRPLVERVGHARRYALRVPRRYIRCLRDVAVPPAKAAEYAARLGVVPLDLDCDHGPMLSNPDALVRALTRE